jgi:hypothetical protein
MLKNKKPRTPHPSTPTSHAGALMEVDKVFNAGDLRTALTNSFESLTYWRIDG